MCCLYLRFRPQKKKAAKCLYNIACHLLNVNIVYEEKYRAHYILWYKKRTQTTPLGRKRGKPLIFKAFRAFSPGSPSAVQTVEGVFCSGASAPRPAREGRCRARCPGLQRAGGNSAGRPRSIARSLQRKRRRAAHPQRWYGTRSLFFLPSAAEHFRGQGQGPFLKGRR